MENVNTWKLVLLSIMFSMVGCNEKAAYEINVYEVGNNIVYDTLGTTVNETLILLNRLDSLIDKGETKYSGYSWTKKRSYNDSLTLYDLILTKEQDVYDFQVYRLNNRIVLFRNPEATDYRLLKNIKCNGVNCKETIFTDALIKIDSIMIPPRPSINEDGGQEIDSLSISF